MLLKVIGLYLLFFVEYRLHLKLKIALENGDIIRQVAIVILMLFLGLILVWLILNVINFLIPGFMV
jgi:hypothetical protein